MKIKVISSGSHGNAYVVSTSSRDILLECGVSYRKIMEATNWNVPRLCFVSHEHGDHSKIALDLSRKGVQIICSDGTARVLGLPRWSQKTWYMDEKLKINLYDVEHDAEEPMLAVIDDYETGERLLFVTDTSEVPNISFKGITHLMIEANWSEFTMAEDCAYQDRVKQTHLSLEKALYFIENMDKSRLVMIMLIHLSIGNSDSHYFKKKVQELTGVQVEVA